MSSIAMAGSSWNQKLCFFQVSNIRARGKEVTSCNFGGVVVIRFSFEHLCEGPAECRLNSGSVFWRLQAVAWGPVSLVSPVEGMGRTFLIRRPPKERYVLLTGTFLAFHLRKMPDGPNVRSVLVNNKFLRVTEQHILFQKNLPSFLWGSQRCSVCVQGFLLLIEHISPL